MAARQERRLRDLSDAIEIARRHTDGYEPPEDYRQVPRTETVVIFFGAIRLLWSNLALRRENRRLVRSQDANAASAIQNEQDQSRRLFNQAICH